MSNHTLIFFCAIMQISCSSTKSTDSADTVSSVAFLEVPPPDQGFQLAFDFTAEPYSEVWKCYVHRLDTTEMKYVNSVEYQQNPGMHHMTISTTGFVGGQIEPGLYDCKELYEAQMDSLIMMFGAQGTDHESLQFPTGVAVSIPANIDIVHEVHYVNTIDEPVQLYSRVNAYTIDSTTVTDGVWGGNVRDENIFIPPNSEHTEWTRCVMNEDIQVLFLASHTHGLGIDFSVRLFDGANTGDVFYQNTDWHNPNIVQYEEPIIVPAGTGFEYACTWKNPHDHEVQYGLTSLDEMCNFTYVHTPYSMTARCEVVETSDGVLWSPE